MGKKWGIVILLLGVAFLCMGTKAYIEPNLDEISRLKGKALITGLIGETVREEFSNIEGESFFVIKRDEEKQIQAVQADTAVMNKTISALTVSLQKKYQAMEPQPVEIPIGTIFGSPLLSQAEKTVTVRILPLSVSQCDFETDFQSQGINQTKYQIYVIIETDARILQPFSRENFKVKSKILLSEVVIIGEVPQNYVYVPEEDILDVT